MRASLLLCAAAMATLFPAPGRAAAEEVDWRTDYAAARREAAEKDLPLVVDVGTPDCFWCKRLDAVTFRDPAVVQTLRRQFVTVRLDASRNEAVAASLRLQAYPTVLLAAPDGKILDIIEGFKDAAAFQPRLERVVASLAARQEPKDGSRTRRARELLAQAQEDSRARQYHWCLSRCDAILATYPDLPEAAEARQLAAGIKENPEWMRQACEGLSDQLGTMYLALAETWIKRGQPQQAVLCLERVVQTLPGTRHAEVAQARLAQVQGAPPARAGEPK